MTHASDSHAINQTRRVWPPRTSRPLTREDVRPIVNAVTECLRLAEWDLVSAPWSKRCGADSIKSARLAVPHRPPTRPWRRRDNDGSCDQRRARP